MTLSRLALARGTLKADGDEGMQLDGETVSLDDAPELRAALEVAALCNNASLEQEGAVGDPTEVALLEAAEAMEVRRQALLESLPESSEVSFDPDVKMMDTFHRDDDSFRVAVKGAPEAVLECCSRILGPDGEAELDDDARREWRERGDELASQGLRVMALAQKRVEQEDAEPYADLTLLALAGLYDPPREGIRQAIAACQDAGVRVVMGTGDHAATAAAIAREIGLAEADDSAVEGRHLHELDKLDDSERESLLAHSVFARISPEQKLELIRSYQDAGWVVGMTGDGVNDAPGLKKADIGIAMGRRGTEVAREVADMVLKDDAFATIVAAIEHGRTIFGNIRRFIVYLLSGNLGEIMAISAAALVGAPLPMLPLQILYINFVADVMPALALGLSPGGREVMRRPPRDPHEPILQRRHWIAVGGYGALIAAAVLGAFGTAMLGFGMDEERAVGVAFLTFGFARLWHVFNMRSPDTPLLVNEITGNPLVWIAIAIGGGLLLAAAYVPLLAELLSVQAPGVEGWLLCIGFSLLPLAVVQAMKLGRIGWESRAWSESEDTGSRG
jgi:Ca2+-transporting ATPase